MAARFIVADVFDGLRSLPDASVDLVISSPPFLALRSYLPADHPDKAREIGSEATPADFLDTLLDVVECRRVLAPHGSLVFELGDTYAGSGGAGGDYNPDGLRDGQPRADGSARRTRTNNLYNTTNRYSDDWNRGNTAGKPIEGVPLTGGRGWPLPKSLCGIPTLFAWSLAYGRNLLRPDRQIEPWRVRNLIAWCRPNPPVGALGDKFRPATSYLTVACTGRSRWFDLDAVRTEPLREDNGNMNRVRPDTGSRQDDAQRFYTDADPAGAPPLDWWEIPTEPYKGSHYATWPRKLLDRPILAMCPRRVCTVCGQPSERITGEPSYVSKDRPGTGNQVRGRGGRSVAGLTEGSNMGVTRVAETVGWSDCGHGTWRPGVVLDPFAGSGTTLAVAVAHGREAIGIDLDSRNAELARDRVGMWLTVEHLNAEGAA